MKSFRITSWTVNANEPDITHVMVSVLSQLGLVTKTDNYEFSVSGRFDAITPEFEQAVQQVLMEANLI